MFVLHYDDLRNSSSFEFFVEEMLLYEMQHILNAASAVAVAGPPDDTASLEAV